MNHIKTILFLVSSLLVGVGIGKGYLMWKQHNNHDFTHIGDPAVITGVGDAPNWRGFVVRDPATLPGVLAAAQQSFATAVGIEYPPESTRESLIKNTKAIHDGGMRAVLLPPPVFNAMNPFGRSFKEVAADAQAANVEFFCISWLDANPDTDYWLDQSVGIRGIYRGRLIFAGLPSVLIGMECWDAGDLLGAIGPVSFARRLPHASDDVKPHDLRVAWDCPLTSLEFLARAHGKKLALLNMNIPQAVSFKLPPPESTEAVPPSNPVLQGMLYEALLLETKGRAEHTELMLFNWGAASDADAPNNVPGLIQKVAAAWDPKKPKVVETIPGPTPDDVPDVQIDAATDAAPTTTTP